MDSDPIYDFAEDVAPPKPVAARPVASPTLAYQTVAPRPKAHLSDDRTLRDVQIPLYIAGGALLLELIDGVILHRSSQDILIAFVARLLVCGTFSSVGIWLAARRREVRLGPPRWVPVKLIAFAIAPTAIMDLLNPILRWIPFAPLIGLIVVCYTLLGVLFDLDQEDSRYFLCVVFVANVIGFFALLLIV